MVPSGSGSGGISCDEVSLFESRSTSQTSSGSLKFFLYIKKLAGSPITYGVGARRS